MSEKTVEPTLPLEAEKRPNRQISVTVPAELYDGYFDHTWTAKKKIGQLFRAALDAFAEDQGIAVDGSAPHAE